jgi:hypothetical protein
MASLPRYLVDPDFPNADRDAHALSRESGRRPLTWWQRNEEVIRWVRVHPSSLDVLLPWFVDPPAEGEASDAARLRIARGTKRAYHALRKLCEQERIKYHWSLRVNPQGRPIDVYCGWACKMDTLKRHELPLTYFCRAYRDYTWIRGYRVPKDTLPDAVMIGDRERLVEFDSGEESAEQYREHMARYATDTRRLLIVAPYGDTGRMEQLIGWGEHVNHLAAYTTLDRAMRDPYGCIWVDATGKAAALKKPSEKPSG